MNRLRHPWLRRLRGHATAHNQPAHAPRFFILWLVGFGALQRAPHHIALASEPAQILNAGSLYWLGQRRRQATVSCNAKREYLAFCCTPGPPAIGREYSNLKKHED
jgi:hypothetical protein